MALVRTLLFQLLFLLGSIYYVLGAILVAPVSRRALHHMVHGWARWHRIILARVLGIRFAWDGRIPDGPVLVAVKHETMVEAVDTLLFAQTPVVVMKRELTVMPFFGKATRLYGVIGVDRDAGASALRAMMAEAKAARDSGRPIIIFPEGTRIPHGQEAPLRPGFAGLYRILGLPVVPVAVDSGRVWTKGFVKRPGTIRVRVGETIPPGLKREEIEARVHAAINALQPNASIPAQP